MLKELHLANSKKFKMNIKVENSISVSYICEHFLLLLIKAG